MRLVFSSLLFFFLGLTVFSQDFSKLSLRELLESTKNNPVIVVEGYYVDNSSFMVTRSSDVVIYENKRYAVYEYKQKEILYAKAPSGKIESPVFMKSGMQGTKHPRILFLNKKRSNDSQLVVEEATALGLPIVDDRVEYVNSLDGSTEFVPLDDFRDFIFSNGEMPQIDKKESAIN